MLRWHILEIETNAEESNCSVKKIMQQA